MQVRNHALYHYIIFLFILVFLKIFFIILSWWVFLSWILTCLKLTCMKLPLILFVQSPDISLSILLFLIFVYHCVSYKWHITGFCVLIRSISVLHRKFWPFTFSIMTETLVTFVFVFFYDQCFCFPYFCWFNQIHCSFSLVYVEVLHFPVPFIVSSPFCL